MKKLKLPVIKNMPLRNRVLSNDEYLEFVLFNLKQLRKSKKLPKRMQPVDVAFVL